MAAAAIPIITSLAPAIMGLFGRGRRSPEESAMSNIPPWLWQQAQDQWGRANEQYGDGQWMWDRYLQMLLDEGDQIPMTPDQLAAQGSGIYGGEDVLGQRRRRTDELGEYLRSIPGFEDLYNDEQSQIDQIGQGIGATYDTNENLIREGSGEQLGRLSDLRSRLLANITGSYGRARDESGAAYGQLATSAGKAFDDMGRLVDTSEAGQLATLDQMRPYSQQSQARVARSFAPALASTALRLRRNGVDSSSLEGDAALRQVEAARSRAVDDQAGDDARFYTGQRLSLVQQNLLNRLGLGRDRTGMLTDLGVRSADINRGLTLDEGAATRGADTGTTSAMNTVTSQRTGQQLDNSNLSQERSTQAFLQRIQAIRQRLAAATQGYGLRSDFTDRGNADDQYGRDVSAQNYQAGQSYQDWLRNWRLGTASLFGNAGNTGLNRAQSFTQAGNQAVSQAYGGYQANDARNVERSSSLWSGIGSAVGAFGQYANDRWGAGRPRSQPSPAGSTPPFMANIGDYLRRTTPRARTLDFGTAR